MHLLRPLRGVEVGPVRSSEPAAFLPFLGPGISELTHVDEAASRLGDAPFVTTERGGLVRLGYALRRSTTHSMSAAEFRTALDNGQALHRSSRLTDVLLAVLRTAGKDRVLSEAARTGPPLIGAGAGSIILGNDITPGLLMNGPTSGITLDTTTAIRLVDPMIVPHADGRLPPYSA